MVAEALPVATLALGAGIVVERTLGTMLVTLLNGIFDPPPSGAIPPWSLLALLVLLSAGGIAVATAAAVATCSASPWPLNARLGQRARDQAVEVTGISTEVWGLVPHAAVLVVAPHEPGCVTTGASAHRQSHAS